MLKACFSVLILLGLYPWAQAQITERLSGQTCPECQEGEQAIRVSVELASAFSAVDSPPCKENLFEKLPALFNAINDEQLSFGFAPEGVGNRLLARFIDNLDNDVRHQIANRTDATMSSCVIFGAILPFGSSYQGYGLSASSLKLAETYPCNLNDGFCFPIPFAIFSMTPRLFEVKGRTVIVTEFRNYNSDTLLEGEVIQAHLTVYYRP